MQDLIPKIDPTGALQMYKETPDGHYCMGIYRVAYGYRVRAGGVGQEWYDCDWCCGANKMCILVTYQIMELLLTHYKPAELPNMSTVKPWPLDVDFIATITTLLEKMGAPMNLLLLREIMLNFDQQQNLKYYPIKKEPK